MNRTELFMAKVNVHPGNMCWNWAGARSGSGYGQFWDGKRKIQAHWFLLDSQKAAALKRPGMEACHSCDNRLCVRPSHIFIGTRSDNEKDKISKGRHNPMAARAGCLAMLKVRRLHRGESNHASKLTEEQARKAKACPRVRGAASSLAKKLGVSLTVVCDIRDGKRWKHL